MTDVWLFCCKTQMVLHGHLEREGCASGKVTRLAYECPRCFKRVQVVDGWGEAPSAATLVEADQTP